jgi:uncharacterized membrane protein (UPF0127 family)
MLFLFPDYQVRQFGMVGMNFSLDIIWLKDKRVVGWAEKVSPPVGQNIPVVSSVLPVNAVLEVNAGWAAENQLKIGEELELLTN